MERLPGQVRKLGACDELIEFSDVLPTLAGLAGAVFPQGYALDGKRNLTDTALQGFSRTVKKSALPRRGAV